MSPPPGPATWIVERTQHRRFPFRVSLEQEGRLLVAFRTQARWPGPGQQVFCLREGALDPAELLSPVERAPVAHLARVGRKLVVALDRGNRKRCEFLTVVKPDSNGRSREQIFFRTASGIRAHRSRTRVELGGSGGPLRIGVDSGERYPWRFPADTVERRRLAVGDYALLEADRVVAVVERKSYDNWLSEVGAVQALHQSLADLASQQPAALVIEADYRDFLDPGRLAGRWPPLHLARVFAEVAALHPTLPVIFAGNRALANAWTARFFRAVAARRQAPELELELTLRRGLDQPPRGPGLDAEIAEAALQLTDGFRVPELASRFPDVPETRLRRVLQRLRGQGRLMLTGRGRAARWGPRGLRGRADGQTGD
jgi:hypothetical protein